MCTSHIYATDTTRFQLYLEKSIIYCDNTSAINLSKNPTHHARTKHIDIRHHFLRDNISKEVTTLECINTEKQIVDILTKPLNE